MQVNNLSWSDSLSMIAVALYSCEGGCLSAGGDDRANTNVDRTGDEKIFQECQELATIE